MKVWIVRTGAGYDPEEIQLIASTKDKAINWINDYLKKEHERHKTSKYIQNLKYPQVWDFRCMLNSADEIRWSNFVEFIYAQKYKIDKAIY